MPATVIKVKDVPPEQIEPISIDANFLIKFFAKVDKILLKQKDNSQDFIDCLEYLLRSKVICCVSDLVIEEIYYLILRAIGCPAWDYNGQRTHKRWQDFCRDNPSWIEPAYPIIDKFNQLLSDNAILIMDYERNEPGDSWLCYKANELIQKFHLISNDAFIIAHGFHCGVTNFLTADKKWDDVDGITIYKWQ